MKGRKIFKGQKALILFFSLAVCFTVAAVAQAAYPEKTVTIIATGGPGSGSDTTARALISALEKSKVVSARMVVENQGGGGGNIAMKKLQRSRGDGYLMMIQGNRIYMNQLSGTIDAGPTEITPVARLMGDFIGLIVRSDSPYKSAREVLEKLKADPEAVPIAVGSQTVNADFLNVLYPAKSLGIPASKVKLVPMDGQEVVTNLLGGHIPAASGSISEFMPYISANKVRVLAISADQRHASPHLKDVPTWSELGLENGIVFFRGLFAPPEMPEEALKYWVSALTRLQDTPEWKKTMQNYGWDSMFVAGEPFKKILLQEKEKVGEVLKEFSAPKK